jgi:hypothetical protein
MNTPRTLLICMTLAACGSSLGLAATVTGNVKGPEGSPLVGVFVQAQNNKTHITYMVLSDSQGHYRLQNLPSGDYALSTKISGYRGEPRSGVKLTTDQQASFDMSLQKSPVRWNEISIYQAGKLWPASPAKDKLFSTCFTCHGFQTRIATVTSRCRELARSGRVHAKSR